MVKTELITILKDWNFWSKELPSGIQRPDYSLRIRDYLSKEHQIVVVSGPRRSGKSYLMRQAAKELIAKGRKPEEILFVNFEDPRFEHLDVGLLDEIWKAYTESMNPRNPPVLFLDEIQEVDGWERWVRSFHELGKGALCVSGSNAALLGGELGSVLTGRHLDVVVSGLSFEEFLKFKGVSDPTDTLLEEYLEFGGFPEVVLSDRKKEILLSYFDDVLDKDIIHRFRVRKTGAIKSLAKYYFSNISVLTTFSSLQKSLGLKSDTIEKFSIYFEDAYLFSFLKRFSWKVKEQENSPRKLYCGDTGLANAVGFHFSRNSGALAENAVFNHLSRRKNADPSLELYYWKDPKHREVDFVTKDDSRVSGLIQCCRHLQDERTRQRELKSLFLAMEDLKISEGIIVTDEEEQTIEEVGKKVTFVPLSRFLLG